mgnify:CR=1 FL=1
MNVETITSRQNPLMTHLRKLGSSRSYRVKSGEYLCDGTKLLQEALKWSAPVKTALFSEGVDIPELPGSVRAVRVSEELMRSVSPMETPQGALFTVALPETKLPETLAGKHYLVLDGVQDPGNVGTILRTADAFECDGVFLVNACADLFNPKTARATMGAIFRRDVYQCTADELCALLQKSNLPLYGTALRNDTVSLRDAELSRAAELVRKGGAEAVLMRGGVPDSAANALIAAGRALNGLEIICEDGSRLLLSHKNYEKLVRAGARFTVMNKTRLLAVTVNPFSAKGSHYNKTEFYDAMCSGLGGRVPVLDVVSEFGCEAAE